jgi:hypothetical protein
MTFRVKDTGPLSWNVPIVDMRTGRPTPEFQRRWEQQRTNNDQIGLVTLGEGVPTGEASDGEQYFDITSEPFVLYVGYDGEWNLAGGGVTSFNGRTGAVIPASGDYTASQVTNAAQLNASNTFSVAQIIRVPGGAAGLTLQGETGTTIIGSRNSNDTAGAIWRTTKGRGTIASPTAVLTNDILGTFDFRGYGSTTMQRAGAQLAITVTDPAPSATAMGTRTAFSNAAHGSIALTETLAFDVGNGLYYKGSQIVDSGGTIQINSAALDQAFSSTQGTILYRNSTDWVALAPGTAGDVLKTNGAGADPSWTPHSNSGVPTGTSFPGSPTTGDKFYRTDRNIEYFYDGTRWLSTQLFVQQLGNTDSLLPFTATSGVFQSRMVNPWAGKYSIYIEELVSWYLLVGAGNWTVTVKENTGTVLATLSGLTTTAGLTARNTINTVFTSTSQYFYWIVTENSGAASLYYSGSLCYRLVG